MSCYLVQEEDGVSRFTLEDGSGFILLEYCPDVPPVGGPPLGMGDRRLHHEIIRRHPPSEDYEDEELIAFILGRL